MLLLYEIKCHILRAPVRTTIIACIAALLVCGMAFYQRNIQITQETLEDLAKQMPVQVCITNREGSSSSNLRIGTKEFDALAAQDVRDVLCTSVFSFTVKSVDGHSVNDSMRVCASSAIAALNGLVPDSFNFLNGWDENFLQTSHPVCAVESSYAKKNGLELGSKVEAEVFSLHWDAVGMKSNPIGVHEMIVVAVYDGDTNGNSWNACAPIGWLRNATETAIDHNGHPVPFFYDSVRCYLANPREINAFKDAMYEHGFMQRKSLSDDLIYDRTLGNVLSMDDEMYIKTSADLVKNLELYNTFMLPFFGLIILIICLITFILLRSYRQHIAIASSLGRQKILNAATPFLGTVIVQAFGCILALLSLSLTGALAPSFAGIILSSFMLCAATGTALALVFLFRFDTLTLLTKTD